MRGVDAQRGVLWEGELDGPYYDKKGEGGEEDVS